MQSFDVRQGTTKSVRATNYWIYFPAPTSYTLTFTGVDSNGNPIWTKNAGADVILNTPDAKTWQIDLFLRPADTSGTTVGEVIYSQLKVADTSGNLWILADFQYVVTSP